jgi:hypothetical protein
MFRFQVRMLSGSVDATEYFDQRLHGGEVGGTVQQNLAEASRRAQRAHWPER